jgi:hypothetical protein
MADDDLTIRILRDIQRELVDMRDDRTVIVAILNRLDASVNSLSAELRAMRNQFARLRNEIESDGATWPARLSSGHRLTQPPRLRRRESGEPDQVKEKENDD